MLSLPRIAGGSRKNSFSHTSRNLKKKKKSPEKKKTPILGWHFMKSYACKLEKLQAQSEVDQIEVVQISIESAQTLGLNGGNSLNMKIEASRCIISF